MTAAALLVMPTLASLKRRTGKRLGSRILLADAAESLFCAYLSTTVLVGLVLNVALGWWWADPIAALAVVPLVIKEGLEAVVGEDHPVASEPGIATGYSRNGGPAPLGPLSFCREAPCGPRRMPPNA